MGVNKKRVIAILIVVIAVFVGLLAFNRIRKTDSKTKQIFAMDTVVTIKSDEKNLDDYVSYVEDLSKTLSAYDENSEISRLNKNGKAQVSDDSLKILTKAKKLCEKNPLTDITAGSLVKLWNVTSDDPKVPNDKDILKAKSSVGIDNLQIKGNQITLNNNAQLDLGCCAKGYALDVLYDMMRENNEKNAVVSFGSSSLLYGKKADNEDFTTAVVNPDDISSRVLTFKTGQSFVSTSGGYERFFEANGKKYCHIIDLETGYPVDTDLTSVTVISQTSGLESDFMSTCIFIDGTKNINKYLENENFQVIAFDISKNIYCSKSIKNKIKLIDQSFSFK